MLQPILALPGQHNTSTIMLTKLNLFHSLSLRKFCPTAPQCRCQTIN